MNQGREQHYSIVIWYPKLSEITQNTIELYWGGQLKADKVERIEYGR